MNKCLFKILLIGSVFLFSKFSVYAQTEPGSDELYAEARKSSFDDKDYPKAIELCKKALSKSPEYYEIRTFLARIYTWSDKTDSARAEFKKVLERDAINEGALEGITDLEYWNDNLTKALEYSEQGLKAHPLSENLVIKKAKILNALGQPVQALKTIDAFKVNQPHSVEVLKLESSLRKQFSKNRISGSYTYTKFDKRFNQPWHLANLSYGRFINGLGTVYFGTNFSRRFGSKGFEFEAESYPSLAKGLYAYVGGAYSKSSIFPNYRAGLSIYKSLPGSLEVEGGFRYLNFGSSTTLFVVGLGRYFGNKFVSFRSYLTPSEGQFSKSFNLSGKFLLSDDRNDFFNITLGTGISPDDRARRIDVVRNLKSFKASVDFSKNIANSSTVVIGAGWVYEEYATKTFGNQYTANVGFQQRF